MHDSLGNVRDAPLLVTHNDGNTFEVSWGDDLVFKSSQTVQFWVSSVAPNVVQSNVVDFRFVCRSIYWADVRRREPDRSGSCRRR